MNSSQLLNCLWLLVLLLNNQKHFPYAPQAIFAHVFIGEKQINKQLEIFLPLAFKIDPFKSGKLF